MEDWNRTGIEARLKKELDKSRFRHTVGVMYTAGCLAMRYGQNMEQAMLAGLLHDCAKCIEDEEKLKLCKKNQLQISEVEKENPFLLHAKLGALFAKKTYGVTDEEILHAIEVHTTGAPAMNMLDKIIFVSDYIEPNRDKAPNLMEIREVAFEDIERALLMILKDTLSFLGTKKGALDPRTKETYEYYNK